MRFLRTLFILLGLAAMLWFAAHWYAQYRIRTAFAEAGMSDKAAACMAHRLTQRLSLLQIRKLQALREERKTVGGLIRAARRIDDGKVVRVTSSSIALCTAGLAQ